jgi:hypothetical protein
MDKKLTDHTYPFRLILNNNQSTEGADLFLVSECQKVEGCEIINQFVFV